MSGFKCAAIKYEEMIATGCSEFDILSAMKEDQLPIIEVIKLVRQLFDLRLGEAKDLVVSHPAWAAEAKKSEPIQRLTARIFSENG